MVSINTACYGLRTKLLNLNYNTSNFNFIFIKITETWLNCNFFSAKFGLGNYNIYKCHRSSLTSNCERGSGVLITVHKDIPSFLFPISVKSVEQLFFLFSLNFIISCVHLPVLYFIDLYKANLSTIDTFLHQYPMYLFVICGDYALPHISWSNETYSLCYSSPSISQ